MSTVRDFGARGDGKTDDTKALQHAVRRCCGELIFPRGVYLLTQSLEIPLQKHGRFHIAGQGGTATIQMRGAGPALRLIGTHSRTADPGTFADQVWQKERMPMVRDLEILGGHAQADGIRIEGVMQPTVQGLLIRRCRHGIHLANRNRNVVISNCHIYHNTGVGVFFDRVNLHQSIIEGSHISYCKQGGIKIAESEIRNLQICGNDIEYNYDLKSKTSADVLFDCTKGTVREGTLVGNTIQARQSPGGANVRFLGAGPNDPNAVGLWAITGNLIGSQTTAIDLRSCRGVTVTGNSIYSGYHHAVVAENCEHLVIGANSIDHNPQYRGRSTDKILLRNSRNVNFAGVVLQHTLEPAVATTSSMEIRDCQNINVTGCQIINASTRGIHVLNSSAVRIADCTIRGRQNDAAYRAAVEVERNCSSLMVSNNFLGRGQIREFSLPPGIGSATANVMV